MQPTLRLPACRISGRLLVLLPLLLSHCLSAQNTVAPMIGPIPNQVTYVGGVPLVVPLPISAAPAGIQVNVSFPDPSRSYSGRFQLVRNSNQFFLVLNPIPVTAPNITLGNIPMSVSAYVDGVTNQVSFILTVLPDEFNYRALPTLLNIAQPVWADFNGDGLLDLGGNQGFDLLGSVRFQLRQPDSQSFLGLLVAAAGNASGIVPADFNGDGQMDMMLLGYMPVPTALINAGNMPGGLLPNFTTTPLAVPIPYVGSAAWADLDGDGDLDLVITGNDAKGQSPMPLPSRLFRNDGGGKLTLLDMALPAASGPVVAADFDGDGVVDLLLTNTGTNRDTPLLLHNDGEGTFTDTGIPFPHGSATAAGWSDFNGDGIPDVWLQFKTSKGTTVTTNQLVLLQQQDDGRFGEILRLDSDVMRQTGTPAFGDFDNDGTTDFIAPVNLPSFKVANGVSGTIGTPITNSVLTVWHNDGKGHFLPRGVVSTNAPNVFPAAGDMDGDGALDLALPLSGTRTVVTNPNRPANFPPSAPGGLQAFAEGRNLFFFWNESTDPNQTAPLTYNLRVGTRPGANDIVASMSLSSGTRQLVAPGNCGFSTFRDLRLSLPEPAVDALYWSVQAVDNSFVGGAFAAEQTLMVDVPGNRPPVITGLSDVDTVENAVPILPFNVTDDRTRPEAIRIQLTASNPLLFPAGSFTLASAIETNTKPPKRLLVLRPARDSVGESDITVIAMDAKGLSSTVTFHVTITRPTGPTSGPSLQLLAPAGGGALRFNLRDTMPPGLGLERSEDLLHWSPVTGVQFDSNSLPGFSLPQPADKDRLFYRLSPAR